MGAQSSASSLPRSLLSHLLDASLSRRGKKSNQLVHFHLRSEDPLIRRAGTGSPESKACFLSHQVEKPLVPSLIKYILHPT